MTKSQSVVCILICFFTFNHFQLAEAETFNIPNGDIKALIAAMEKANANTDQENIIILADNGRYVLNSPYTNNAEDVGGKQGPVALPPIIGKKLIIEGKNAVLIRNNTASKFRILFAGRNSELVLKNLTVENGDAGKGKGGGVYLTFKSKNLIENCKFINNTASSAEQKGGGALSIQSNSTSEIRNCEFIGNTSNMGYGGAICNVLSDLTLDKCVFRNNKAIQNPSFKAGGGAVYIDGARGDFGKVEIEECIFDGNESPNGGGIFFFPYNRQQFVINKCEFKNNQATTKDGIGGGVWYSSGTIKNDSKDPVYSGGSVRTEIAISNTAFYYNSAGKLGGGLNLGKEGRVSVFNCTIAENKAGSKETGGTGGGINVNSANLTLTNCTIAKNYAGLFGGGIGCTNNQYINMYNCIIAYNETGKKYKNNCQLTYKGSNNLEFPKITDKTKEGDCCANIINEDPLLGPLNNNGGKTLTFALKPGSPAIDKGINKPEIETDQRGVKRKGAIDLGAYERNK